MFPVALQWKFNSADRGHCEQPHNLLKNQARVLALFVEPLQGWLRIQLTWGSTGSFSACVIPAPSLSSSPPRWHCRNRLSVNWGHPCTQSLQAEVGQGCNVLLLTRYFDLTPPFFICFTVLCLTLICSRQPPNFGDPPFTNKFTRMEPVRLTCISGNLNLSKEIYVKHYL